METIFASIAEQNIARCLRDAIMDVPVGEEVADSACFRDILPALEYFVPEVLMEIHPEWKDFALDGFVIEAARRTGELQIDLVGLCIFIDDQTMTPIHLELRAAPDRDEIVWLDCRLGESGPEGMVKLPFSTRRADRPRVAARLNTIDWVYYVGFGERQRSRPG